MAALGLGSSACPHLLSLVEMEALYARPPARCACASRSFCQIFGFLGARGARHYPLEIATNGHEPGQVYVGADTARPLASPLPPPRASYSACAAFKPKVWSKPYLVN